jgi:flagellar hook-associated protein 3 FlgL
MSVTSFSRLGTANAYDNTLSNLTTRQNNLANLQESLSSGKKITSPSDDPTGAAQAERALNRLSRIATDQRALEVQRNAISMAESTLGDVTSALQEVRDLVVSAGNGSFSTAERKTVALQISSLRDRILSLANSQDSNGQPLFAALGSALKPFAGPETTVPDYTFNGLPGSASAGTYAIASALDGESAFMLQAGRDAAYNVKTSNSALSTNNAVKDPNSAFGAINGSGYTIEITGFDNVANTVTYNLIENPVTPGSTTAGTPVTGSLVSGGGTVPWSKALGFTVTGMPGLSLTVKGTPSVPPAPNDIISVDPNVSVFSTVDHAINDISTAGSSNAANQAVTQALHNIDISMSRIAAVRGQAGDLLNRADSITATNDKRNIEQEANRSRAEDIDMIKGVSDFQKQQTGYQAALQSYAQIQKLSLFNYIG